MTASPADAPMPHGNGSELKLKDAARDHLWMHFSRLSAYQESDVPMIVRGDGPYVYDSHGKRYLDGLAGLFVVQVGHGRVELAEAAMKQASELAFFPLWSYAHPQAAALAERLANHAPGDLNRIFFTTGGGEAVETAWKLAKQYYKLVGKPMKHKVISRYVAYHGTPQGALSITGIPELKQQFEPLVPSTHRVPNTNLYRASDLTAGLLDGSDPEAFGRWAAEQIALAIEIVNIGVRLGGGLKRAEFRALYGIDKTESNAIGDRSELNGAGLVIEHDRLPPDDVAGRDLFQHHRELGAVGGKSGAQT